jgi:hypothetical protein
LFFWVPAFHFSVCNKYFARNLRNNLKYSSKMSNNNLVLYLFKVIKHVYRDFFRLTRVTVFGPSWCSACLIFLKELWIISLRFWNSEICLGLFQKKSVFSWKNVQNQPLFVWIWAKELKFRKNMTLRPAQESAYSDFENS